MQTTNRNTFQTMTHKLVWDYEQTTSTSSRLAATLILTAEQEMRNYILTSQAMPISPNCQALTTGTPARLITVFSSGMQLQFISKLQLCARDYAQRYHSQLAQLENQPINSIDWLYDVSSSDIAKASVIWKEYSNLLQQDYQNKKEQCCKVWHWPIESQMLAFMLDTFMRPTPFDIGLRCKATMRRIALSTYGAAFANKLSVLMAHDSFIPYISYHVYKSAVQKF